MSSPLPPLPLSQDPHHEGAALLGAIACLSPLSGDILDELAAASRFASYAAGDIVGGPAAQEDSVAFVSTGRVRVSCPPDRHGDIAFHDVPAGQVFGHLEALSGEKPQLSAVALSDVRIAFMPAAAFLTALETHPAIAVELLRAHALEAISSEPRAPREPGEGAPQLYAELLRMAESDPQAPGQLTISKLPRHRELAGWTSLAENDVAAALAGLVKIGCVERRYPGLVILDADRLRQLAIADENIRTNHVQNGSVPVGFPSR